MVNSSSFKRCNISVFLEYTIIVENHLLFRGPRSFKYLNIARFFLRKYRVVLTCFINNVDCMECGILSFKSTSFASALFIVFRFVDLNISRLSARAVSFIVEIRQSSGWRLFILKWDFHLFSSSLFLKRLFLTCKNFNFGNLLKNQLRMNTRMGNI